ncbi:helix-turn-helix domain-containing protein [Streptomyces cinereoruber]|uniref:helix-turn-helix domain-containing protein n=1 Tax=Streptomyces cinereoruber TaxID=67260 RepID=UPI00362A7585
MTTHFDPAAFRSVRDERGLSRMKLAVQIDVHADTIVRYERGIAVPSVAALCRAADALGCPVGEFFTTDDVDVRAAA